MTSDRRGKDTSAGAMATVAVAAAGAAVLAVRWLSRLDDLQLAGLAAGLAAAGFACWAVWPRRRLPRHRVRHMRLRARMRLYPGHGHATAAEMWLRWGRLAAARRARRSRPSLSVTERLRPRQTSVLVARAHYGHGLRVPVEEHVIYVAPPRQGKSGTLADIIDRYPGPVVATTTRADLHALTAQHRATRGPVYVFNPQQLADVPSSMRWDVLSGCEDPATAIRRAEPLSAIAAYKGEGDDFWAAATALWLQTLMHVAALPAVAGRRGRRGRTVGAADPRPDDLRGVPDHRHDPVRGRRQPGLHGRPAPAPGGHPRPGDVQPGRVRPRRRHPVPDR